MALLTTISLIAGCAESATQPAQSRPFPPPAERGPCTVTKQSDVPATMRDGTILRADVYRPSQSPVPVILMRTQYSKSGAQTEPSRYESPDWFASHCYLVVVQDVRGTGSSSGIFDEYTHDSDDGYDSVEWAANLTGSDGKVGMYGSSYVGATQWLAAVAAPPHLVTIVPANTASDYYDGWTYEGGEFRLAFILPWSLGLAESAARNRNDGATEASIKAAAADPRPWMAYLPYRTLPPLQPDNPAVAPWYFNWIAHWTRDGFWTRFSIRDRYRSVRVPVLDFAGWYDAFAAGSLQNFSGMVADGATPDARKNQRIVIGPWDHLAWGRAASAPAPRLKDIGPVADSPINQLMLEWYDHFLKGVDNQVSTGPRVDYFLMGANTWKTATSWPLPQTDYQRFYLSGDGDAVSRAGRLSRSTPPASQAPDRYTYDPANPVSSVGGHSCCSAQTGPQGPYDQRDVEKRDDVMVYSSEPLHAATEVTGPVSVDLWAASSATDTDFTAKLDVVKPDGTVINLNDGILRTVFRNSLEHPEPGLPNTPYKYRIAIWPTSYLYSAGDRIRLEISSSDYPQFAPNPNTGDAFGVSAAKRTAEQSILHDGAHPSALILPVIPTAKTTQLAPPELH